MPPRLEHKKSRRGCQRCKVRKVKCDEIHPVCSACQRHQVHCVYTDDSISPHKNPPSTSSARSPDSVVGEQSKGKQLSPWGPASPYDLVGVEAYPPEERRLLELHLLHRYLTRDVVSFQHWNDTETLKNVWLTHAVTMGLKHSFLLNAIFALAALHAAVVPADENYPQPLFDSLVNSNLASVEGVESVESTGSIDYAKIHRIHLNLAVSEVRQALSQLSSSNAEALCLVSIILSIMAQKLIPEHNEMSQEYTPPVQYLSMSHSITTVFQASIPLISHTSVLQSLINENEPDFRDPVAMFNPEYLSPFQSILDFQSPADLASTLQPPEFSPETQTTYRLALTFVGGVYAAIRRRDPQVQICRRVMSFGPMVQTQFITLLQQHRPRALVTVAHLMSLARCCEAHFWWFRGAAHRDVLGIHSLLPPEWHWAMRWPRERLDEFSRVEEDGAEMLVDVS